MKLLVKIGANEDKDKVKNLTTNVNHERYIRQQSILTQYMQDKL